MIFFLSYKQNIADNKVGNSFLKNKTFVKIEMLYYNFIVRFLSK